MLLRTPSFNHFIGSDLLKIIRAKGNERVTCDADPNFYLKCARRASVPTAWDAVQGCSAFVQECSAWSGAYPTAVRSCAGCRYTNIYVGRPSLEEDYIQASAL